MIPSREERIFKTAEHGPNQTIPDNIMFYAQYGWKLGVNQETAVDTMVNEVTRSKVNQ